MSDKKSDPIGDFMVRHVNFCITLTIMLIIVAVALPEYMKISEEAKEKAEQSEVIEETNVSPNVVEEW